MADTKMSWAIRPLEFSQTTATGKRQSASSIRSMAADHEAAHAVVGIRLEMKLVKIERDSDRRWNRQIASSAQSNG